jgi:putative intracellular protease/amidase
MLRNVVVATLLVNLVVAAAASGQDPRSKSAAKGEKPKKNVAVFLFNDVQIIDYTGPYEVFVNANANGHSYYNVFTVAVTTEPIKTIGDMTVTPKYRLDNHPKVDVLVLPGGWGVWASRKDPKVIAWIQKCAKDAEVVLSVCNGAFFLSKAGLLDGKKATTTAAAISRLQAEAPRAKLVSDKRFVDNGKIVTAGGLSAGIDGALHVVEKTLGKGWAQMVAVWMEYDWQPNSKYARALLADYLLPPPIEVGELPGSWQPLSYTGGTDHWENKARVATDLSAVQLREAIDACAVKYFKWSRQSSKDKAGGRTSAWTLQDRQKRKWRGAITVEPAPGAKAAFLVAIRIDRDPDAGTRTKPERPRQASDGSEEEKGAGVELDS